MPDCADGCKQDNFGATSGRDENTSLKTQITSVKNNYNNISLGIYLRVLEPLDGCAWQRKMSAFGP